MDILGIIIREMSIIDKIIIGLACVELVCYIYKIFFTVSVRKHGAYSRVSARRTTGEGIIKIGEWVAGGKYGESQSNQEEEQGEYFSKTNRSSEKLFVRMFDVIIDIFPLLGTLGTVIGLLGVADSIANIQDKFFLALTSTFWGLLFAITFKALDSLLPPAIYCGADVKNMTAAKENKAAKKPGDNQDKAEEKEIRT